MIKLSYCLRRLPGVSRADFQHYWRTTHAPLVAAAATTLGVLRYVQSHTIDTPLDTGLVAARGIGGAPYDGVAELWWQDEASLVARMSTPEGQAASAVLLADEAQFIDFSRSAIFFGQENAVVTSA